MKSQIYVKLNLIYAKHVIKNSYMYDQVHAKDNYHFSYTYY